MCRSQYECEFFFHQFKIFSCSFLHQAQPDYRRFKRDAIIKAEFSTKNMKFKLLFVYQSLQ
jgi:hypothetical protein